MPLTQILLIIDFCSAIASKTMSANAERTYLMVKPDGVQRGLVGEIIKRLEQKGFKLVALKFVQVYTFFPLLSVHVILMRFSIAI